METTVISGFLLILLAGGCSGTFALPFKHNSLWKWENNWFIWSIIALLVAPWIMAFISIPDLGSVYAHESDTVLLVAFFGLYGELVLYYSEKELIIWEFRSVFPLCKD